VARLDDGCSSSRHYAGAAHQAVRAPPGSVGAGSSKGVMVWAQAPPRQRRRGLTMVGLNLGSTGLDLGSEVFLFLKINFWY
jgi:hypothetical protein